MFVGCWLTVGEEAVGDGVPFEADVAGWECSPDSVTEGFSDDEDDDGVSSAVSVDEQAVIMMNSMQQLINIGNIVFIMKLLSSTLILNL